MIKSQKQYYHRIKMCKEAVKRWLAEEQELFNAQRRAEAVEQRKHDEREIEKPA